MGSFAKYLEQHHDGDRAEEIKTDAAEFLQHAVRSMISEGQGPNEVYNKAIPIFGEEFLIEAGIVEIAAEQENK